jgi:hypothetical protein
MKIASINIKIQNAIVAAQDGGLDWKKKLSTHAVNATIAKNKTDLRMICKETIIIGSAPMPQGSAITEPDENNRQVFLEWRWRWRWRRRWLGNSPG